MIAPHLDHGVLRTMTAPQLLCARARQVPQDVAFRVKQGDVYMDVPWCDYADMVARAALALSDLGLHAGERLAILAGTRPEWAVCDLAAQSLGAIVYGIYPTSSTDEIEYQLRDGGASVLVIENGLFLDKFLPVLERLPGLQWIIAIEGVDPLPPRSNIRSYAELLATAGHASLDWLEQRVAALSSVAPAFIVYTSGTTGNPKGAVIAHGNHVAAAASLTSHYPTLVRKVHSTVAYLPLCHVLGRVIAITLPLMSGLVPHYGSADLSATLREVRPTIFFAVPRFLQKFASQLLLAVRAFGPLERRIYDRAMRIARNYRGRSWTGQAPGLTTRFAYEAAQTLVFRPLLRKVGFDRIEALIFGGAPISPELIALWQLYGVNLVEIYGQTESGGGIISGQLGPFPAPGNVGVAPPGWDLKLSESGEVLVKSPYLFVRYWNNETTTEAVKPADGWMRTGDIGEMTHGSLRLVDRARDFIVTSGGKTISPSHVENALRASPYLSEAVVFGHGKKYLTAIVEIEADMVSDWARSQGIVTTSFNELTTHPLVLDLISREVASANELLARVEQIKTFRILPRILDPREPGEPITPTRKIKRQHLYVKFQPLIDGMYEHDDEHLIAAEAVGARVA